MKLNFRTYLYFQYFGLLKKWVAKRYDKNEFQLLDEDECDLFIFCTFNENFPLIFIFMRGWSIFLFFLMFLPSLDLFDSSLDQHTKNMLGQHLFLFLHKTSLLNLIIEFSGDQPPYQLAVLVRASDSSTRLTWYRVFSKFLDNQTEIDWDKIRQNRYITEIKRGNKERTVMKSREKYMAQLLDSHNFEFY